MGVHCNEQHAASVACTVGRHDMMLGVAAREAKPDLAFYLFSSDRHDTKTIA